jgi:molybdenum cofactor cytidylyltransferase
MSIAAVILAAGNSSRMGQPKQLLEFNKTSLIRHVATIALASKADSVSVVLGWEAESLGRHVKDLGMTTLFNPNWQEGISSSIRSAVSALWKETDAVMFLLCDQLFITSDHLDEMIDGYLRTGKQIVASAYGNTLGVPALFGKIIFPELLKLKSDHGARRVILSHEQGTLGIPFPAGEFDVDYPSDYEKLALLEQHPVKEMESQ